MIKKILGLGLIVAMLGCSIIGCGKKTEDVKPKIETETEVAEEEVEVEVMGKVPVKFGLVLLHDETSSYCLNFLQAAQKACEEEGVELLIKYNVPETAEAYEACCDLVDRGCNLILCDSFSHESFELDAAKEHPNIQFCHATGFMAKDCGIDNFHDAFAHIEQGRYLAGVAAGMKMNELGVTKCGYVGALDYSEVNSGMNAYYLGIKSVCPEAEMVASYTGSWFSIDGEQEMAMHFIEEGAGIISGHADSPGMGQACKEKNIPFIGYNMPFDSVCPDQYIISSKIDWTPYFKYIINCVRNGEQIATDWSGDFSTGSIVMTELCEENAAPGTKEKLEEVKQGLIDGTIKVFDINTFTVNGEKLESNIINDNETIIDGAYEEGYYQCAPSINFIVDGITIE